MFIQSMLLEKSLKNPNTSVLGHNWIDFVTFVLICSRVTFANVQGLFLDQCSEVTSGIVRGTICGAKDEPLQTICMQACAPAS